MISLHWSILSVIELAAVALGFIAGAIWFSVVTVKSMAIDPEWWHYTVTDLQRRMAAAQEHREAHRSKSDRA